MEKKKNLIKVSFCLRKELINRECRIFLFISFNRVENEWINDETEKLFARFITLLGDFTYAGFNEIKLSVRPETIIDIPNFIMPQPKKTGKKKARLRNLLIYLCTFFLFVLVNSSISYQYSI
jgi:hypothetical protein